jgi:hypothetical protein
LNLLLDTLTPTQFSRIKEVISQVMEIHNFMVSHNEDLPNKELFRRGSEEHIEKECVVLLKRWVRIKFSESADETSPSQQYTIHFRSDFDPTLAYASV